MMLLLLSVVSVWAAPPVFQQVNKPCPPGCLENGGTCNEEFGRCDCRFGFGGDACEKPLLPACMSSLAKGAVPQYGWGFPKNCYCYKQLMPLSCSGDFARDPLNCNQPAFWAWDQVRCYEYTDLPPEQQLSDPPEEGSTRVVWKKGVRKDPALGPDVYALEPLDQPHMRTHSGRRLLPLGSCANRCSERGSCQAERDRGPACACAPFYRWPDCGQPENVHCPHSCSGRGTCDGGFCRCQRGYWGAGCTRSRAFTAAEWSPHPTELKVYVYDLPEAVTYMRPDAVDEWPIHFPIYLAEIEFYHQLLGDWGVRTENPWEANLFFVPTHTYYFIGNVGFPGKHFTAVFKHVRESYPWWNMTAGRNHVVATSNDRGCCDLYRMGADVQHPIKLVHFAQAPRHVGGLSRNVAQRVQWAEQPEQLAGRLQSSMEDPAMLGAMAEFQHLAGRPRFRGFPLYELPALQQEREQCYRPEHDVAFPPILTLDSRWLEYLPQAYSYDAATGAAEHRADVQRSFLFYFSGYSKPDLAYSAGVRQGLLALFGNSTRPDVTINKGGGGAVMLRSRFCFTPMGFGWGIRLSQAMATGCVPVMVHDHTWPTLWDVLPYERFSVRLNRHNLYRLFDVLESITPEQLRKLQQGLAQYHTAFIWQPEHRGTAYNYTLLSLHRRLLNMWQGVF